MAGCVEDIHTSTDIIQYQLRRRRYWRPPYIPPTFGWDDDSKKHKSMKRASMIMMARPSISKWSGNLILQRRQRERSEHKRESTSKRNTYSKLSASVHSCKNRTKDNFPIKPEWATALLCWSTIHATSLARPPHFFWIYPSIFVPYNASMYKTSRNWWGHASIRAPSLLAWNPQLTAAS